MFRSCLLLLVLASCATNPSAVREPSSITSSSTTTPLLSIAFTAHRHGILEPCGCSLKPLGGLPREWALIQEVKKTRANLMQVSAGVTFPSWKKKLDKEELTFIRDRAKSVIQALQILGVDVLSPAAEDLILGKAQLLDLAANSKFPWVSSNLYSKSTKKPLFSTMQKITKKGIDIYVLGLSSNKAAPKSEDLEVRKPDQVLPALLQSLPKDAFVVLLSSLNAKEREAITRKYDNRIHLILGGQDTDPETGGVTLRGRTAYYHTDKQARKVGVIDLGGTFPITQLFSPTAADEFGEARAVWQKELAKKSIAKEKKKFLQGLLKKSDTIPLEFQEGMTWITAETVSLDDQFDQADGPMKAVLDGYYEQAKQRALQSTEE